ncbi:MAG: macro domain-containing protein [Pseudomonadota bacterium]
MIEFVEGNMFDVEADIRVNTVNCVGAMGAGVARAFRQRNPEMFKAYNAECKRGNIKPGEMFVWKELTGDWIVNFPTKRHWRDPSRYEDIESGLMALREYLQEQGSVTVALPALGCGNGGLDWSKVSKMIENSLVGLEAHIKVFAPSASRMAGHSAYSHPTEDEVERANQLGFSILSEQDQVDLNSGSLTYFKGNTTTLSGRWIAVFPSRSPSDREFAAVSSIANAMAMINQDVTVALVLSNATSERMADLFASNGINVLLVLPFGVLTRKSLARWIGGNSEAKVGWLSVAPPSEKWNRNHFSSIMQLLLKNSCAALATDPTPEWLIGNSGRNWQETPLFYLNYGSLGEREQEALRQAGAWPISKEQGSGLPKLTRILELCERHIDS